MQKKKRLAEYVVEDIKQMLLDGRLKEGDKLPNQNDFAKQLGVSRLTLREGLQTLEIMGVVEQRPKTGTIIRNANPAQWEYPIKKFMLNDEDDTRQMLLARCCLEPTIAAEALKYISPGQMDRLAQIYYELFDAYRANEVEEYLTKDKEFHLFIAESCGNRYLFNMYEIALSQVDIFMKNVLTAFPDAFEKSLHMHRAIYEALTEKDADKLEQSVDQHSQFVQEIIAKFFHKGDTGFPDSAQGMLYYP